MARRGRASRADRRSGMPMKAGLVALGVVAVAAVAQALAVGSGPGERFVVETNPYIIGQAPDWLDDTHVVWHDPSCATRTATARSRSSARPSTAPRRAA